MSIIHPLKPIYNEESKVLILGSFPSVISRKENFYYANKTNRFWKVLEIIFNESITDKVEFLHKHNIALWDVIKSCDISSSKDSTIKNVIVNDISGLLKKTKITKIYINGKKAYELYLKYLKNSIDIEVVYLPSTSSANATYNLVKLVNAYKVLTM